MLDLAGLAPDARPVANARQRSTSILSLRAPDPIRVWGLPKPDAIALLPTDSPAGRTIRAFDAAVRAYYPTEANVALVLDVIARGAEFFEAVKAEYST
jgi:hypothetical protein